jgi:ATP-binding cassette subfamily B protein
MSTHKKHIALRSYLRHMATIKGRIAFVFACFMVADGVLALIPLATGRLIAKMSIPGVTQHQLLVAAIPLIVCSILHDSLWKVSEILFRKLLNAKLFSYETAIYNAVISKQYGYFTDKFSGKISAYVTNLGLEYRIFVSTLNYSYADQIIKLPILTYTLFTVNTPTALLFIVSLVVMFYVGKLTVGEKIAANTAHIDAAADVQGYVVDGIANYPSVIAFAQIAKETNYYQNAQTVLIQKAILSALKDMIFWQTISIVVRWVLWPLTIVYNVVLFSRGQISLAQFTVFITALALFSDYIWGIVAAVSGFITSLAGWEESYRYLFGDKQIDFSAPVVTKFDRGYFKQINVGPIDFAYPDQPDTKVLQNLSLSINKGDKIGIVGRSGGGKSTLFKLLLGYYDLNERLQIDGQSVAASELSSLISYVPQDTSLFHRSIGDNIAYAASAAVTPEQVAQAAVHAHAAEFIDKLPKGYDTIVGERGVKLSIGQRQRIAIARAFLDNKPVLLLDEATSALDSESEQLVQKALQELWSDKTVIAIAHRLSTLKRMDKIIVIQDGKIVEQGTHAELLKAKGVFAQLWAHQSGGMLSE